MRLLIVSYYYAPAVAPRAFRWTAVAEHWAAAGHRVDVVAAAAPGLARFEERRGVRVHRVGNGLRERVRAALTGSGAPESGASVDRAGAGTQRPGVAGRVARWTYDRTWRALYWPDFAGPWYFAAAAAARQLAADGGHDGVVTVSDPFTCHLVGARLHRDRPGRRWLVDLGDPFCFRREAAPNNQALYARLNARVEGAVFRAADAVTVTTERTRTLYADLFPASAARMAVVPPLLPEYDPDDHDAAPQPRVFPRDDRIRLVFTGTLYRTIREPDLLLRLVASLQATALADRVELHFLGAADECVAAFAPYRAALGRWLFVHGRVSRARALQAMREATVLVNIGNETMYQLPSKVLDYVAMAKPVLNVTRSAHDSAAVVLRDYPAALTVAAQPTPPDADAFARQLVELVGREPVDVRALGWADAYRVETLAAHYERLLAGVARTDG